MPPKPLPLCAHCHRRPVKKVDKRYCSVACGHASLKVVRARCAAPGCQNRVKQKHSTFCSKRCAWLYRRGYEHAAKGRVKALAVNRAAYTKRLRARLMGMTTAGQVWRAAYKVGYTACWQAWLRKLKRGDVIRRVDRRDREVA